MLKQLSDFYYEFITDIHYILVEELENKFVHYTEFNYNDGNCYHRKRICGHLYETFDSENHPHCICENNTNIVLALPDLTEVEIVYYSFTKSIQSQPIYIEWLVSKDDRWFSTYPGHGYYHRPCSFEILLQTLCEYKDIGFCEKPSIPSDVCFISSGYKTYLPFRMVKLGKTVFDCNADDFYSLKTLNKLAKQYDYIYISRDVLDKKDSFCDYSKFTFEEFIELNRDWLEWKELNENITDFVNNKSDGSRMTQRCRTTFKRTIKELNELRNLEQQLKSLQNG